jgi:hypothetical protein
MTRKECEQAIVKKLREIWDIYQEYYPGGEDLTVCVTDHSAFVFNRQYLDGGEKALDYFERVEEVGADASNEW